MKLKHAESKQSIDVRDDMVDVYLSQGWEAVEEKAAAPKSKDD